MDAPEKMSLADDSPTRARVVQAVLRRGASTASELAEELRLTPAAIRRHLDHLVHEGVLVAREPRVVGRRGRGRPAKEFVLTDAGRERFTQGYDDLAVQALSFVRETGGDEAVAAFARARLAGLRASLERRLAGVPDAERPEVLAEALTTDGFAASASSTDTGVQLCQHHCPVAHVAEQFPDLCEAETAMFAELLGTHVQRLATIAHGDGVCTTHLPHPVHPERVSS